MVLSFEADQSRVRLYAGAAGTRPDAAISGVLRAYDAKGVLVGHDGPRPVTANACVTPFEVRTPAPVIRRVVLGLVSMDRSVERHQEVVAIDDLEFEGLAPAGVSRRLEIPKVVRTEVFTGKSPASASPSQRSGGLTRMAPRGIPLEDPAEGSFGLHRFTKWVTPPPFDLAPGQSRQIEILVGEPALVMARAHWYGPGNPPLMVVVRDRSRVAKGRATPNPPVGGTVLTQVQVRVPGVLGLLLVNEGQASLKVNAVVGVLPLAPLEKRP
jgi:hypothetical protein